MSSSSDFGSTYRHRFACEWGTSSMSLMRPSPADPAGSEALGEDAAPPTFQASPSDASLDSSCSLQAIALAYLVANPYAQTSRTSPLVAPPPTATPTAAPPTATPPLALPSTASANTSPPTASSHVDGNNTPVDLDLSDDYSTPSSAGRSSPLWGLTTKSTFDSISLEDALPGSTTHGPGSDADSSGSGPTPQTRWSFWTGWEVVVRRLKTWWARRGVKEVRRVERGRIDLLE